MEERSAPPLFWCLFFWLFFFSVSGLHNCGWVLPGIWSPEHYSHSGRKQLLATTFPTIAENSKLEFRSFPCKSKGKLDKVEGKLLPTEIQLERVVTIQKPEDHDIAMGVLAKSESVFHHKFNPVNGGDVALHYSGIS